MAVSETYQKLVLDDLKTYAGIYRPVKSSILARILIRKQPTKMLHPNPSDEFCDPAIGPAEAIVSDYITAFGQNIKRKDPPVQEKLIVQRISTGGYMLLNGHHRWMAAVRMQIGMLPVSIVNPVSEAEIISTIVASDKRMCASFDLDEVLMTDCRGELADHSLPFPYNFIFKKTLRKHAGLLISELQAMGFDVWVYSGSAMATEEVKRLMSLHKARINGMVTMIKGKKGSKTLQQAFRDKYQLSLHIDNESVLWVNTQTREYDSLAVSGGTAWAADVLTKVRALEVMKQINGEESHA